MSQTPVQTSSSLVKSLLDLMDDAQRKRWERGKISSQDIEDSITKIKTCVGRDGLTPSPVENKLALLKRIFLRFEPIMAAAAEAGGVSSHLTWSAVKIATFTLLEIATIRKDVIEATLEGLVCIADHLPWILLHDNNSPTSDLDIVGNAVNRALDDIHTFLESVAKYFTQSKIRQRMLSRNSDLVSQIKSAKATLREQFQSIHYVHFTVEIRRMKENHNRIQNRKLVKTLNPVNASLDQTNRTSCLKTSSCDWAKRHPNLSLWLQDEYEEFQSRRLWIHGNPGTGKSTLAAYLIRESLKSRSEDEAVIFFFCEDGIKEKRSVRSILQTLIFQLLQSKWIDVEAIEGITDRFFNRGSSWQIQISELEDQLASLLSRYAKARIVIDGLDASEDAECLISIANKILASHSHTKVLLLCRGERHIQTSLQEWTAVALGGLHTTEEDINTFVTEQVDNMVKEIPHLAPRRQELRDQILKATGSMFLLARLFVQHVIRHKSHSRKEIDELLTTLPPDLDGVYDQYFKKLFHNGNVRKHKVALKVLQWLVYSDESLSLDLLSVILAIELGDDGLNTDQIPSNLQDLLAEALGILVSCHSDNELLLQDHDQVLHVHLIHQSLRDFLRGLGSPESHRKREPYLFPVCKAMQTGHLHLVLDYSKSLCSKTFRPLLVEYLNDTDSRRSERPREERLSCPEARSGDGARGILEIHQGERGQRVIWKRWDHLWCHAQLIELDRARRAREVRQQEIENRLSSMRNKPAHRQVQLEVLIKRFEQELESIRRLRSRQKSERCRLDSICDAHERELVISAQRNLSRHIGEASQKGYLETRLATLSIGFISMKDALRALASVCSTVRESPSSPWMPTAYEIELSNSFHTLISSIHAFISLPLNLTSNPHPSTSLSNSALMAVKRFLYQSDLPEHLFHPAIYEALRGLPTHQRSPVAIIAELIINARRVETALYRYDEQYPVLVGSSWLIFTLQGAYESLARWIALLILQQSSSETQKDIANLKELFKDDDYFLSLIILHDNQVPKVEPQPGPEHHDSNRSDTSPPPVQDDILNHRNASAVVSVTTHRMVKPAGRRDIWLLRNFIIDFVPTTILWLFILSRLVDYLPVCVALAFIMIPSLSRSHSSMYRVGCIMALHMVFERFPLYRPIFLLLSSIPRISNWLLTTTLIPFSNFRKQPELFVPGSPSSTALWYFTHDGNLCIHPPILCDDQQGILYIGKWIEKLLRIIYAITTCISNDRAKERLFWTLSAFLILLPMILRPLSPIAIIGVLFLHSYGRIQKVLDPSGLVCSRYLLEVTEMESKVLECEMDRLYLETRKALIEQYTKLDPLLST